MNFLTFPILIFNCLVYNLAAKVVKISVILFNSKLFYFELNLRLKEIDFLFVYPASLHLVVMKNVDKEFHKNLILKNEIFLSSPNNLMNNSLAPLIIGGIAKKPGIPLTNPPTRMIRSI